MQNGSWSNSFPCVPCVPWSIALSDVAEDKEHDKVQDKAKASEGCSSCSGFGVLKGRSWVARGKSRGSGRHPAFEEPNASGAPGGARLTCLAFPFIRRIVCYFNSRAPRVNSFARFARFRGYSLPSSPSFY